MNLPAVMRCFFLRIYRNIPLSVALTMALLIRGTLEHMAATTCILLGGDLLIKTLYAYTYFSNAIKKLSHRKDKEMKLATAQGRKRNLLREEFALRLDNVTLE